MWNLRPPIRDCIDVPCIVRQILNHWTPREVLMVIIFDLQVREQKYREVLLLTLCLIGSDRAGI